MKYLIFDSGPIISLTMSGMLSILAKLKEVFRGEFVITPSVKYEIVDKPMKIKKYKLEAVQVKDLLDKGILKLSSTIIPDNKLNAETKRILKITDSVIRTTSTKEKIKIIQEGEASCLAFANLCNCENAIVIDERTTRLLTEAPQNLEKMMEKKLHMQLDSNFSSIKEFRNFKFIRSAELLYIAHKKGLIPIKRSKDLLDALLYGVKFHGAAISEQEIQEMERLG